MNVFLLSKAGGALLPGQVDSATVTGECEHFSFTPGVDYADSAYFHQHHERAGEYKPGRRRDRQ